MYSINITCNLAFTALAALKRKYFHVTMKNFEREKNKFHPFATLLSEYMLLLICKLRFARVNRGYIFFSLYLYYTDKCIVYGIYVLCRTILINGELGGWIVRV